MIDLLMQFIMEFRWARRAILGIGIVGGILGGGLATGGGLAGIAVLAGILALTEWVDRMGRRRL